MCTINAAPDCTSKDLALVFLFQWPWIASHAPPHWGDGPSGAGLYASGFMPTALRAAICPVQRHSALLPPPLLHPTPKRTQLTGGVPARNRLVELVYDPALGVSFRAALGVHHRRKELYGVERRFIDRNEALFRAIEIRINLLFAVLVVPGQRCLQVLRLHSELGAEFGCRRALYDPSLLDFFAVIPSGVCRKLSGLPDRKMVLTGLILTYIRW